MSKFARVTDDVKPRREYTILASQVTDAHEVLDKPGAYADGSRIPPKYSPHTSPSAEAGKKSTTPPGTPSAVLKKEN